MTAALEACERSADYERLADDLKAIADAYREDDATDATQTEEEEV
jgi:hypothetical protein